MKRVWVFLLWFMAVPAWGQQTVIQVPSTELTQTFTSSTSGICWQVPVGVAFHTLQWESIAMNTGTVKLQGSNSSDCSSPTDIIAAQTATSSGNVASTEAVWPYIQVVTASFSGTSIRAY